MDLKIKLLEALLDYLQMGIADFTDRNDEYSDEWNSLSDETRMGLIREVDYELAKILIAESEGL